MGKINRICEQMSHLEFVYEMYQIIYSGILK